MTPVTAWDQMTAQIWRMPPRSRLWPRLVTLPLVAFLVGACLGPDAPSVQVLTDRDHYTYLDPVLVTVVNETADSVYQELCEGALEGYGNDGYTWSASYGEVHSCANPAGVAISRRRPVPPHGAVSDTFFISALAYSGRWRINLGIYDAAGVKLPETQRISKEFTVR